MEDRVRITSAAQFELLSLVPRAGSRAAVMRHLRKLDLWKHGTTRAMDVGVTVIDPDDPEIKEFFLTDCFGFDRGIRAAFFEDVLISPNGAIWVIGFRRDEEVVTEPRMRILLARKLLIEAPA